MHAFAILVACLVQLEVALVDLIQLLNPSALRIENMLLGIREHSMATQTALAISKL